MDVSWFPINRSLRLELNEQERRSRVLAEESHIFKDKVKKLVILERENRKGEREYVCLP